MPAASSCGWLHIKPMAFFHCHGSYRGMGPSRPTSGIRRCRSAQHQTVFCFKRS